MPIVTKNTLEFSDYVNSENTIEKISLYDLISGDDVESMSDFKNVTISEKTQANFDPNKYQGKWYEFAKIPFKW